MNDPAPLIVPRRFCGPESSGNGGWTAGALAALVPHDCPENRARSWPTIRVVLLAHRHRRVQRRGLATSPNG